MYLKLSGKVTALVTAAALLVGMLIHLFGAQVAVALDSLSRTRKIEVEGQCVVLPDPWQFTDTHGGPPYQIASLSPNMPELATLRGKSDWIRLLPQLVAVREVRSGVTAGYLTLPGAVPDQLAVVYDSKLGVLVTSGSVDTAQKISISLLRCGAD